MKILQINSVCGVGSTGRIATDLYKVIEEAGHECVIAYGRGTAPEGIKTIKIGTNFDNYIHVAKTRVFDKHGFGSTKATKEFIKKVEEYDPDVIHLHNIHGYYINVEILFNYLKKSNKKVVWTLHDCWAFTGHCAYFDYVGCSKWKEGCKECPQKKEYPNSLLMDNSQWNFNKKKDIFTGVKDLTIVTPSKWLAGLVKESYLSNYKVEVINNGIDLDVFKPTKSNFRERYDLENKFVVLGVANEWNKRKRLDVFHQLANKLDEQYKIIVVGINEKQRKELPDNIIKFTKTNNIKELIQIYSLANVYLNASVEETMGLTTVEALACGIPSIVNNRTAIPEVIDSKSGIVLSNIDIDEVINAITLVKNNEFNKNECINQARKYNKYQQYNKYLDIYKKLYLIDK